jgi:opacity protein-like surface antigen
MSRIIKVLAAALAAAAIAAPAAQAVERPFKLVESGTATLDGQYVSGTSTGRATHLGHFSLYRRARLHDPDGSVFKVDGYATITAANGDLLFSSLEGTLDTATGRALLAYEWEGGTGRFEDARGSTTWRAVVNPDLTFTVEAAGVIDY